MFGLAVLFGFFIYFWISVGIVLVAVKWARSNGIKGWKWGVPVGFFMLMTVFWDLIPVYAVYAYQCKNNAGFTIYKPLDEWKQENPGIAETLNPDPKESSTKAYWVKTDYRGHFYQLPDGTELIANYGYRGKHKSTRIKRSDGTKGYWLNQRFVWITKYENIWHIVRKTDERIVDTKTGEIIAQYIDFSASAGRLYNTNKFSDYKVWFEARSCERDMWPEKQIEFNGFFSRVKKLGGKKNGNK